MRNGDIDRRPGVVVECAGRQDVVTALAFGREKGLEISVRGGGHSFSGSAVTDDGLVIDLGGLRRVTVDPASRTALVGGGALWADVDEATQRYGLAPVGGTVSDTGVGGNFGVATEFEFRLHRVGLAEVATLPPGTGAMLVGLIAPPVPFVPAEYHLVPGLALVVTGFDGPERHARLIERIRDGLPTAFELVSPMP